MKLQAVKPKASTEDTPVVPPPTSTDVGDRKIVLYNAYGQVLVRKVGF